MFSDENMYDDIINLPHHTSKVRPRMSMSARAAQFGAFDPLSGYEEAILETARLTDEKPEIDEYSKADINNKLLIIEERIKEKPLISVSYFVKDSKKEGGAILFYKGNVKKFDAGNKLLISDGCTIPFDNILSLEF